MARSSGQPPSFTVRERIEAAADLALDELVTVITAAAIPLTPLKDGELRGSQDVIDDVDRERTIIYRTPYAAAQHEGHADQIRHGKPVHLEFRHYTTPGTGPKYLEIPFKATAPRLAGHIAKRVQEALHG